MGTESPYGWLADNEVNDMDKTVQQIADQENTNMKLRAEIDAIRKAVRDCFGKSPISCDGIILVPTAKYNALVEILNKGE